MAIVLRVRIFPGGERSLEVEPGTTYSALLRRLEINPESVVVLRDGLPVPDDDVVAPGEVHVVRVVSGGATSGIGSPAPGRTSPRRAGSR